MKIELIVTKNELNHISSIFTDRIKRGCVGYSAHPNHLSMTDHEFTIVAREIDGRCSIYYDGDQEYIYYLVELLLSRPERYMFSGYVPTQYGRYWYENEYEYLMRMRKILF